MTTKTINWQEEVEKIKEDLMTDLFSLLRIDSVRDDSKASEEFPVGPGPAQALQHFLKLAERDGFQTENFDNWAGHIDLGDGDETLGILAHVDVVPIDSGWESDPFEPIIKNNRLYARGSSDDKGPAMAAYYAMKIVRELGLPLNKKIRFIIGTDEESDWQCMDHYFSKNPQPDLGFSPDAYFPIINGEKGNVSLCLKFPVQDQQSNRTLLALQAGQRENMVPQDARAEIQLENKADASSIQDSFKQYLDNENLEGKSQLNDHTLTLELTGQASHGAKPQNGRNAGTYLAQFLADLNLDPSAQAYVDFIRDYLHDDPFAQKVGLNVHDDLMGDLTSNTGILSYQQSKQDVLVVNFRYPQNIEASNILNRYEEIKPGTVHISQGEASEPHYVSGDDPLVQTLLDVYERQTGKKGHEVVIGGGTYARTLDRGVAYGALFPDSTDTMHQANEFIDLDDLWKATAIYAEAIYELCR